MELDAFKGSSKGSKGSKGGKGKSKEQNKQTPDKDVTCHLCGKKGHRKASCWHNKANGGSGEPPGQKPLSNTGKGKGQQNGKGKARKARLTLWKVSPVKTKLENKSGPMKSLKMKRKVSWVSSAWLVNPVLLQHGPSQDDHQAITW